jgi:hypothetical protein
MCEECTRSVLDNLGLKSCQVALGCWDWVEARAVSWRKTTASKTNLAVTDNLMQTIQLSNISTPHSTTPRQIQTYSYMMWEKKNICRSHCAKHTNTLEHQLVLQSSSVMKANSMASETWRIGDRL